MHLSVRHRTYSGDWICQFSRFGLAPPTCTEKHKRASQKQGYSSKHPTPGVTSFAAPVFDYSKTIVLGITLMGSSGTFDPAWNGPQAKAIKAYADEVSKKLGFSL